VRIISMLIMLAPLSGIALADGDKCFCKACCAWTDRDSCDFSKVEDVACDLPVERQKDSVLTALSHHVLQKHGANASSKEFGEKTEIKCYRSAAKPTKAKKDCGPVPPGGIMDSNCNVRVAPPPPGYSK
jgi:hypothetical protein